MRSDIHAFFGEAVLEDALHKAYKKAGHIAFYRNGFVAGAKFAVEYLVPMDQAPRDGRKILVFSPEEELPFVAYYHPEEEVWVRVGSNTIIDVELAGFQKLPVNPYYKGDKV